MSAFLGKVRTAAAVALVCASSAAFAQSTPPSQPATDTPKADPTPAATPTTTPAKDDKPKDPSSTDSHNSNKNKNATPKPPSTTPTTTPANTAPATIGDRLEPGSVWTGKDKDGDTFTVKVKSRTPSQNSAKLSITHTTGRDHFDMEVTYSGQTAKVVSVTRHVRSTGHMSTDSTPSVQLSIDAQNTLKLSGKAEFDTPNGKRKNMSVAFNVTCQPSADDEETAPKKKKKGI